MKAALAARTSGRQSCFRQVRYGAYQLADGQRVVLLLGDTALQALSASLDSQE